MTGHMDSAMMKATEILGGDNMIGNMGLVELLFNAVGIAVGVIVLRTVLRWMKSRTS